VQVSPLSGVFLVVEQHSGAPSLELIESVRCLDCGVVYSKPARGGTMLSNPGCPECGYLGWLPVALPFERPGVRRPVRAAGSVTLLRR
jgi:hypothetical protein